MTHGMWNLPRQGMEPVSPALAGGFFPPDYQGSPQRFFLSSVKCCPEVCIQPRGIAVRFLKDKLAEAKGSFLEIYLRLKGSAGRLGSQVWV